ncbi:lipoprotein signal peptidase [Helicobacter bizzozeronii CIII-1]|uniref:Lipoprotein signal peptidase n=1 Tax=Helicobacter bizzozeronii (strain CIII-1) TaxID=1002804 RepID=F8KS92_HELBC|nr:Lipoprotein signal peptidase IspA [Helicobacter bizzozeronii]CCB79654.1 lipoprotein signal peptidase [Helicobacter bizzozeronii CIII-1]
MRRALVYFSLAGIVALIGDQALKQVILEGFRYHGPVISIVLAYNKGVAFSMLDFLGPWLKYLQVLLIVGMAFLLVRQKEFFIPNALPFGLVLGAGSSNILDRFVHGGVVDYVYWHYKFDFAVFNLADVLIDVGVGLLVIQMFKQGALKAKDK